MDSPEAVITTNITTTKTTNTPTTTSSGSPPVQESPFSNYISNLSPIKPVKAPHVAQGFLGLNSPPLVFTSPRINTLRETSFLKRPQDPQSSSGETPQCDDGNKKFADGPGDVEKSVTELRSVLITDAQHSDVRNSAQVQPSSSSGCVDEYLADPVEVDCANSAHSFNLNLKQPNDVLQSSLNTLTSSKKIVSKFDDKNNVEMKVNAPLALSEKAEEHHQGKSISDIKPVKIEEEQRSGEWPSYECPNTESDLSVDHVSKKQQCSNSGAENAGAGQEDECDCSPQLQHKPSQNVWEHEDCGEIVEEISNGPVDNTMHDPEASQHQRGMSRRCLQFEEAQHRTNINSTGSSNPAYNATAEFESLDSSHADLNATASKRELVKLSQPMTTMFPPRYSGKSPIPVSKPLGIGLHLNSIVNSVAVVHGATANKKLAEDYTSVQQMNLTSIMGCHSLENLMSCSELSYVDDKISICAEDGMPEMRASIAASSAPSASFQIIEHATPHNKRIFNSEHADNFDEFNQFSPKKKRKKSLSTNDGDGCKRCNCKKTKCLKLYCDCFAAGIYCAEPCACQGCFNRPEYEDTVLETRQQIESRNPLAFAPKIVQRVAEFPANSGEDGNRLTPSSARHKRGCNCKKSMCLKKYCECYQANVGCSNGCRCEGCKNVYGRKEEYVVTEEMVSSRASEERLEGTFDDKLEIVATKKDFSPAELYESHNLTPLTPSFQFSDHGKDAPKTRFLSRRYLPSPKSDLTILSSHAKSPTSPRNSDKNNIVDMDGGSYSQEMEYNIVDMDRFLPRFDALADICHLTPLPNPPQVAMGSSASSKTRDQTNVSLLQLGPGSGRLSSGGSLRWRSSPVTPVTQLGGTKNLQGLDSDSGLYDILEDDTPEMLKDASTPTKSVKVNSPNRKRVSPPHSRMHELGSISSGGLKSGRKFILKAVPSFPPLTPCIDSKGSTNQNRSDFQEKSSDK